MTTLITPGHAAEYARQVESHVTSNVIGPKSVNQLRREFFAVFEEQDKLRGVPFRVRGEPVSDDYKIDTTKTPVLQGGEQKFVPGAFSFGPPKTAVPQPVVEVVEVPVPAMQAVESFAPDAEEDEEEWVPPTLVVPVEPEPAPEPRFVMPQEVVEPSVTVQLPEVEEVDESFMPPSLGGTSEGQKSAPIRLSQVATRVPRPKAPSPLDDVNFLVSSEVVERVETAAREPNPRPPRPRPVEAPEPISRAPVPATVPTQVVQVASTLRGFIKNNPGCSIEEAKKHFPEREIQRQINQGRVFLKSGKLVV